MNGYFNDQTDLNSIEKEYALGRLNQETGNWEAIDNVTIGTELSAIPTTDNNDGYTVDEGWDETPKLTTPVTAGNKVYTYTYSIGTFGYKVEHYYEDSVGGKYSIDEKVTDNGEAKFGETITEYTKKSKDGYVFEKVEGAPLTITSKEGKNVIKVYYAIDSDNDDTPDKYEATVTFNVVNGVFEGETETTITQDYVLATQDPNNKTWTAVEKTLTNIPKPIANTGYGQDTLIWSDEEPTTNTKVVGNMTFTACFTRDFKNYPVKITPYSGMYDGQEHNVSVDPNTLVPGDDVEYSLDGGETYEPANTFGVANVMLENDGIYNVLVKVTNGSVTKVYESTIEITPRAITLTSGSATKTYDGSALTNAEVDITSGSLVNDADVIYAATGTITNVGSKDNTVDLKYASKQMEANYDVTVQTGTLTVTQQTIDPGEDPDNPDPAYNGVTIDTPSNAEYDGIAHQWVPVVSDKDGNALVEGTDYEVSYSTDDFTNVTGMITVTITGKGNYTGEVTRTYQITPRAITLTSGSSSKTYDGSALTNSEVSITYGSLANASDVTYVATGTITNVGSSLNRISVSYASEQMAKNYVVTLVEGTLTVNTAPVTPTPTPDGGGTTTPTTPGARTTDDGTTTDEPEVEEVEDEETPLSDGEVEEVEDNATPKSNNSIWALINLIAAIVTVILGLFLLLSKRHRNDEDEDEDERQARMARGEEKEQEQKRGWICKVLGVVVAIVSVVFFILTEDMSLPMALTDKWTIWMIVIAIIELVLVVVGRHWKDVDDDEEQQA